MQDRSIFIFISLFLAGLLFVNINCQNENEIDSSLRVGEVRMGSYGYKCVSKCEKRGSDYYWCDAEHPTNHYKGDYYWDYCSKDDGFDYKGTMCYIEHACGNHGYKYKWCYTNSEKTSWGYCGFKWINNKT